MDETTAVRCLKQGDFSGLEYLMAQFQVKALRLAFLITQDKSRAEDVVQEVFLRIFQSADRLEEGRAFGPYLMRSVVNASLNACRAEKKSIPLSVQSESMERLFSQAASVESQVEYAQIKHEILEALRQLPPRQRAAIVQRYYLGMSEQEMALALKAAPGTVKWLLNAARTSLRSLIRKERI